MHRDGHLGAALLAFAPVGLATVAVGADGLAAFGAALTAGLATVPDCDQRVPLVSHRGVTHTLVFAVGFGLALAAVVGLVGDAGWLGDVGWLSDTGLLGGAGLVTVRGSLTVFDYRVTSPSPFAFVVGTLTMLSHLGADALTPSGVPLLWPLSDHRFSLRLVAADSLPANYGLLVAGVVASVAWGRSLLGA